MKRKYQHLGLILTFMVSILLFLQFPALANGYSDIDRNFAREAIIRWSEREVIKGYQGRFSPNQGITRGELAVIINRILGYEHQDLKNGQFTDLKDDFYTKALLNLNKQKIIQGNNQLIRPHDQVTREEAAVILVRAFQLSGQGQKKFFADEKEIAPWAKSAMSIMTENQYMNGYQNKLNPKQKLTRAELVQLLDNMISAYLSKSGHYLAEDLGAAKEKGIIIIKAPYIKISGLEKGQNILVSADRDNQAVYFKDSKLLSFKSLKPEVKLLLEKTELDYAQNQDIKIYTDGKSEIAGQKLITDSLEKVRKELEKENNIFKPEKDPTLTDQYSPLPPSNPGTGNPKDEHLNPVPEQKEKLLPILSGLKSDGIIYQTGARTLPDKALILKFKNGENTGRELSINWSGERIADLEMGKKGEYLLKLQTLEEVIINQINYGLVKTEVKIIVE